MGACKGTARSPSSLPLCFSSVKSNGSRENNFQSSGPLPFGSRRATNRGDVLAGHRFGGVSMCIIWLMPYKLSLQSRRRNSLDEGFLREEKQDNDRQDDDRAGGHQVMPLHAAVLAL